MRSPELERLRQILFGELAAIAERGAGDDLLAKVAEQLRRKHETDVKDNAWWLDVLQDAYYFGDDFTEVTDIAAFTKRATSANVRAAAHRVLDGDRYALVVVQPESLTPVAPVPAPAAIPRPAGAASRP